MTEPRETITVDANPLLAALRGGKARLVLFSGEYTFITTERTTWEVKKYLPTLAQKSEVDEYELFYAFDHFTIIAVPAIVYDDKRQSAESLIAHRDLKDIDILALALKFKTPIWTNDRDFENLSDLEIFTTAKMLEKLATHKA